MSVSNSNGVKVWLAAIVAIAGLSIPTAALAQAIRLVSVGELSSRAKDLDVDGLSVYDYADPESFPYVGSTLAEIGDARFETTYDFSDDGLFVTFDHQRASARGSSGDSDGGFLFAVDEPVHYTIHGVYDAYDPDARIAVLALSLYDYTSRVYRFDESEAVEDSTDVHIEFGWSRPLSGPGPSSGELIPGHLYYFDFVAGLNTGTSTLPTYSLATGSGGVSLVFTPAADAAVPSSSEWSLLAVMATLMVTGAWAAALLRGRLVAGRSA